MAHDSARNILGLASTSSHLWEQKVNAERRVLIVKVALELLDLVAEHLGGITDTTNDTQTAGVGDSSGKLGASGNVHASKEDGVLDPQEVSDGSAELLCITNDIFTLDLRITMS